MTGMDEHNSDRRSRESGSARGGHSDVGQPGAPSAGDVITAAAGQQVTSPAALTSVLSHLPGGKKITITWVTPAGQAETRVMTLAQAPPQ
jgi:S1-C subfamily serine protease